MGDFEPDMLLTAAEQERVREGQRLADLLRPPEPEPAAVVVAIEVRRAA